MANKTSPVIITHIDAVPVTNERRPWNHPEGDKRLMRPGTARAHIASSFEQPQGTIEGGWASSHRDMTVLQQHVQFFDRDRDGVIWLSDSVIGFWKLGFGIFSIHLAVFMHLCFSHVTRPYVLPDVLFRIHVENIHRAKHGSDSRTYDNEGRFVPQEFENIFSKYAEGRDYMTLGDVWRLNYGQRMYMDPFGACMTMFWWMALYYMIWPEDRLMKKEDVRGLFDGSLFYLVAQRRRDEAEAARLAYEEKHHHHHHHHHMTKKERREAHKAAQQKEMYNKDM